jgi:hypothetical protein
MLAMFFYADLWWSRGRIPLDRTLVAALGFITVLSLPAGVFGLWSKVPGLIAKFVIGILWGIGVALFVATTWH